jgi:hypothetical protein
LPLSCVRLLLLPATASASACAYASRVFPGRPCPSYQFSPPRAQPFSTSVDVFAFGVLLNELWAREVPWDGYQPLDIRHKVIAGERPPTPRTMPYSCETLLKRLWHATPARRPTFDDALHSLDAVIDALPTGHSVGRAPIDSLDSLDSLAGLSLMPQQRGTRGW